MVSEQEPLPGPVCPQLRHIAADVRALLRTTSDFPASTTTLTKRKQPCEPGGSDNHSQRMLELVPSLVSLFGQ